jgi:hypothetical protein
LLTVERVGEADEVLGLDVNEPAARAVEVGYQQERDRPEQRYGQE